MLRLPFRGRFAHHFFGAGYSCFFAQVGQQVICEGLVHGQAHRCAGWFAPDCYCVARRGLLHAWIPFATYPSAITSQKTSLATILQAVCTDVQCCTAVERQALPLLAGLPESRPSLFEQAGSIPVSKPAQIVLEIPCCLLLMLMLAHDASLCSADNTTPSAVPAQTWVYVDHCCYYRCQHCCIVLTVQLLGQWVLPLGVWLCPIVSMQML